MRRALLAAAVLVLACGEAPARGPGLPGGPPAPLAGRPSGPSNAATIGASGGSLSLGDLTVTIPAGAVAADTAFTLSTLDTNTATGAVGTAYRVDDGGVALLQGVTLTFAVADSTGLAASRQLAPAGYWLRAYDVTRTPTSVSVVTNQLGDWTLVTVATQRDLHGPFRLDSTTQDVPFSATGDVTLQFLGEEPGYVYYLPVGTVTPVATGCAAVPPADLPFSIAELKPAAIEALRFRWALNGYWTLSCAGGATPFVSLGFDTMGINNHGCAMDYTAALGVLTGADHLRGQFAIDCGVRGRVVASWDLVPPDATPGALPVP